MSKKFTRPDGTEIEVAWEELALFFNNNTVAYGSEQYRAGMTKSDYKQALEEAGFHEALAKTFADMYHADMKLVRE